MNIDLLGRLCCPFCSGNLTLPEADYKFSRVQSGTLKCDSCFQSYPIVNYIPRFVQSDNYAQNFGLQWNRFANTQLDSCSGHPISADRFFKTTGWQREAMGGKRVLDVGCGAGRFTEIALSACAQVVAVDYSNAVDACWGNFIHNSKLDVVQADIYHLPFAPGEFDYVYCLGVLQHTPNVGAAFAEISRLPRSGGKLVIDVYPKLMRNVFFSKYWLRPVTRHLEPSNLLSICERLVDIFYPLSCAIGKIPIVGKKLRYLIPIANYEGVYPLTPRQLRDWAILDTFDMLAPMYDKPQTGNAVKQWFMQSEFQHIQVFRYGGYVGRGEKP